VTVAKNHVLAGVHPVMEALKAGSSVQQVHVAKGAGGARVQEVIDACRKAGIPVRFEERSVLDKLARTAVHQGVVALATAEKFRQMSDIPESARLVVVLDGVEDPHNLGAIIRTANAAGAGAVIIPERRAAGVTPVVAKAAAGALEHVPLVKVTNINRALDDLKADGFWIYGLDERGEVAYDQAEYNSPTAFVLGGEGHGIHAQTRKHCDVVVSIPMSGAISSLNVSVAAGVMLFEWKRRYGGKGVTVAGETAPAKGPPHVR
jgi:23S rRNA (guanosine2251-2'-O)-methyltransferase